MKFKINDRVICVGVYDKMNINNLKGTIIGDVNYEGEYPINFNVRKSEFHHCDGRCNIGHGWWVKPNQIKLLLNKPFATKHYKGV